MDIKNINLPNFNVNLENRDYYVFADFLKPGYHQLLIYDPKLRRAFCKDFMVNLNMREDIYPEFPLNDSIGKKPIANVWRQWLEDSHDDKFKSL